MENSWPWKNHAKTCVSAFPPPQCNIRTATQIVFNRRCIYATAIYLYRHRLAPARFRQEQHCRERTEPSLTTPGVEALASPPSPGLAPAHRIAVDHSRPRSKARRAPCPHPARTSPNASPMQRSYIYVCPKHIWTWRHPRHAIYMCSDSTCPQAPCHLPCPQPEGSAHTCAWHRFNHGARDPGAIDIPPKELPKPVCPSASPRLTCPHCTA